MRRQTLKFLAMFMVAAIVFSGCKKEQLVDSLVTLNGVIKDYNGMPMEGVKVLVSKASDTDTATMSATTKASGLYEIQNIKAGFYMVSYSKDGYAKLVSTLTVSNTSAVIEAKKKDDPTVMSYQTWNKTMYPLMGSLKGKVTMDGHKPVANTKVVLKFSSSEFDPQLYTATTDAEGAYSFEKLPVTYPYVGAYLYVYTTDANTSVATSYVNIYSEGSPQSVAQDFNLSDTRRLYVVSTSFNKTENSGNGGYTANDENIAVGADIVLNFNQTIDAAKTASNNGYVKLYDDNGNMVDVVVTYSGKTVTINPNGDLKAGEQYELSTKVYAADDLFSSETYYITVKPLSVVTPAALTGLVDTKDASDKYDADLSLWKNDTVYKAGGITLKWNRSANAKKYRIYAKGSARKTEYYLIATVNDATESGYSSLQTTITSGYFNAMASDNIPSSYPLALNNITFKVVPVNYEGSVEVEGAGMELTAIKDEVRPEIDLYSGQSGTANNNGQTSEKEVTFIVEMDEPADITVAPTIDVKNTGSNNALSPAGVTYVWDSNRRIKFFIKVSTTQNFVGNEITISKLKDKAGLESDATKSWGKVIVKLW